MEYVAYFLLALFLGFIGYAAYRANQQSKDHHNSGGYTRPGDGGNNHPV